MKGSKAKSNVKAVVNPHGFTHEDVMAMAARLRSEGYSDTVGRPQDNKRGLAPALVRMTGKSLRTIRKILAKERVLMATSKKNTKAPAKKAPAKPVLKEVAKKPLNFPMTNEKAERDRLIAEELKSAAMEIQQRNGNNRNRAMATGMARDELFREQLLEACKKVFANKITVTPYQPKKKKVTSRLLNTVWSDLHFHSLLDPREVPHKYGPVEEARRMAAVCKQIADYKRHYRDETELAINIAGDIIQNQLHDARDGAPLSEQFAASLHILTQAVAFLSQEFKKVTVRTTPGNHGRNTARHHDRATNQKWDSIETMLYYSLKQAVSHLKNVEVEVNYRPYYIYEAFGERTLVTHGDTVVRPGYPGKSINVGEVRKQINEFNGQLADREKVRLFVVGHVHVGSITHLPNGAVFLSNGCLIPPDAYAQSIGCFDTANGQWLWESVPGHLVGDHRFITVSKEEDRNPELDKIIKPFVGF